MSEIIDIENLIACTCIVHILTCCMIMAYIVCKAYDGRRK